MTRAHLGAMTSPGIASDASRLWIAELSQIQLGQPSLPELPTQQSFGEYYLRRVPLVAIVRFLVQARGKFWFASLADSSSACAFSPGLAIAREVLASLKLPHALKIGKRTVFQDWPAI